MEAMASGRAIITTDTPGCRDTVEEGQNGMLVRPRQAQDLAAAMERFINDPAMIGEMGEASHQLARQRFDVHAINRLLLSEMGLLND